MESTQYQSSSEENALGTSLDILKSSGDNVFRKIHRMQLPKSSNAISPSLDISKFSRGQISERISRTSQAMLSTIESIKFSSKRIFENIPKMNTSNNAMGESYKSLKISSERIFEKISKTSHN